ncbi:hypothetical protein ACLKA7_012698 [Drosophila subpalustris]
MSTTSSSNARNGDEESDEESNFTAAFEAAAINATHRRSSTLVTSDDGEEEDANVETAVENNPTPEPEPEPENPTSTVNTRPTRRRKQTTPQSRHQAFAREVRRLQMNPGFMIPRLSFGRVVRDILMRQSDPPLRMTMGALEGLQTATEMYLTQRFEDAYMLTMHRGRVTLENRDMALMTYICKKFGQL